MTWADVESLAGGSPRGTTRGRPRGNTRGCAAGGFASPSPYASRDGALGTARNTTRRGHAVRGGRRFRTGAQARRVARTETVGSGAGRSRTGGAGGVGAGVRVAGRYCGMTAAGPSAASRRSGSSPGRARRAWARWSADSRTAAGVRTWRSAAMGVNDLLDAPWGRAAKC